MSWILLVCSCLILLSACQGFVLNGDDCPVQAPCRCAGPYIYCSSLHLNTTPSFNFTTNKYSRLRISLESNAIVTVPARAFGGPQTTSYGTLELRLQDNKITSFDDDAFVGMENTSFKIDLSNNELRTIPRAFIKVNDIKEINLLGNPIVFLDREVMTSFGHSSLTSLWLGMKMAAIWPQELSLLTNLWELIVDEIQFHSLPADAFHGMDHLRQLEITKARLETVPDDICILSSLSSFKFTDDQYISNNQDLLKPCYHLRSVSTVVLSKNQLFSFPSNVLNVFSQARSLDLSYNYIDHIDDADVSDHVTLSTLDLSHNQFTAIPAVVSKMAALRTLVISNNAITHVDDKVLSSLDGLQELTISHNPLVHIDPHAFTSLNSLQRLVVADTNLTAIPSAIIHANRYFRLTTTGSPIVCTCDTMYFLNMFSMQHTNPRVNTFYGSCTGNYTNSIRSYVEHELPKC